jgi:hypothetical protein
MSEEQTAVRIKRRLHAFFEQRRLAHIGDEYRNKARRAHSLADLLDLKTIRGCALPTRTIFAKSEDKVGTAVWKVMRVSTTLAAITDHRNALALERTIGQIFFG